MNTLLLLAETPGNVISIELLIIYWIVIVIKLIVLLINTNGSMKVIFQPDVRGGMKNKMKYGWKMFLFHFTDF